MSNRSAAWLAWSLWTLTMALFLLGNLLDAKNDFVLSVRVARALALTRQLNGDRE